MLSTPHALPPSGFGNHFASEAVPGALPQGRNSPQRVAHGLYAELLSGTAFTAPRAENRRTWLYRRQPSVVTGAHEACEQPLWQSGPGGDDTPVPPDPLRWHPFALPAGDAPLDFVDGLVTVCRNGDPDAQAGIAIHVVLANRSMERRALVNADGEMLIVPQQGRLRVTIQGETIEQQFGEKEVCFRTLDLYTSAVLEAQLDPPSAPADAWRAAMSRHRAMDARGS